MLDTIIAPLKPYIGYPVRSLSQQFTTNHQHKGLAGHLIERALGVTNSSLPQPDLPEWGIEIKTIPITAQGMPLEHTFINKISLPFDESSFEKSSTWLKMKKILWVPLIGERSCIGLEKIIGNPFLWTPDHQTAEQLREDWYEITAYLRLGEYYSITSHLGEYLHVRPKAANSSEKIHLLINGHLQNILPIGFYLRKTLTSMLIASYYEGF